MNVPARAVVPLPPPTPLPLLALYEVAAQLAGTLDSRQLKLISGFNLAHDQHWHVVVYFFNKGVTFGGDKHKAPQP